MAGYSRSSNHEPDYFLIGLICVLTVAGLVVLTSASSDLGKVKFNDSYYYLKHQIYNGLLLGVAGFLVAYKVNYRSYRMIALPAFLITLALLALVFTHFGIRANNATRWIRFGPVSFQPAEILKLTFIVYLSAWLSNVRAKREKSLYEGFLPFLVMCAVVAVLLVLQPATSTVAILLLSGLIVYVMSGARFRYIAAVVALGAAGLALLVFVTPYRLQRVMTYINGQNDTEGAAYHINQALIAIGSGGLRGVGYGESAAKVSYLPAPIDDSVFAIVAEELGFVGATTVVVLFWLFVLRIFWTARRVGDRFGRLLLVGFGTIIALQSFVNMAAISGLIPLTGVPLPFISYGGTALAVFLTMSGIIVNVSRYA